ncbi:hypothetical protein ACIPXV_23055 [Streptomyces libani]|uniref:hypothetical protein n=1 Tax=Streptomyces nigrescens TaxID=1920 RepID=UPI0037F5C668
MSGVVLTQIVALVVAAIGTGGAVMGNVIATRAQRWQVQHQVTADKTRQIFEMQREAYTAYIASASAYMNSAWWLNDQLGIAGPSPDRCQELHGDLREPWHSFCTAYAAVQVAGPSEVASAARVVSDKVTAFEELSNRWYENTRAQNWASTRRPREFLAVQTASYEAIESFGAAARASLAATEARDIPAAPVPGPRPGITPEDVGVRGRGGAWPRWRAGRR